MTLENSWGEGGELAAAAGQKNLKSAGEELFRAERERGVPVRAESSMSSKLLCLEKEEEEFGEWVSRSETGVFG